MSLNENNCYFIGNLTRDPESKTLPSGATVVEVGMAVNRNYQKDGEWMQETTYVNLKGWNKQGEAILNFSKGDLVRVETRFSERSYEDANGEKRRFSEFLVNKIYALRSPKKSEDAPSASTYEGSVAVEDDDDIPF